MKKAVTLALIGSLLSVNALAAGALTAAKVVMVRVDKQGQGMLVFDQSVGGTPPSCVIAGYVNAMAFDANTSGGKAILAMALAAKASGSSVEVYGTGTCSIYGNYVEDVNSGIGH